MFLRTLELDMKFFNWCRTGKDELLETAMALHEAAMKDEYFIKRRLAPNVDFWCVVSLTRSLPNSTHALNSCLI